MRIVCEYVCEREERTIVDGSFVAGEKWRKSSSRLPRKGLPRRGHAQRRAASTSRASQPFRVVIPRPTLILTLIVPRFGPVCPSNCIAEDVLLLVGLESRSSCDVATEALRGSLASRPARAQRDRGCEGERGILVVQAEVPRGHARESVWARGAARRLSARVGECRQTRLDLGLAEAVLPEDEVRGHAVLAVVEESDHALGVHGLAGEELPVAEGADDLLGKGGGALLKGGDAVRVGLGELGLDRLHVALEVGEVGLLVERGGLEAERVDNVDDLLGTVLERLGLFLGRGVAANVDITVRDDNLGSVDLVHNIVDKLHLVPKQRERSDLYRTARAHARGPTQLRLSKCWWSALDAFARRFVAHAPVAHGNLASIFHPGIEAVVDSQAQVDCCGAQSAYEGNQLRRIPEGPRGFVTTGRSSSELDPVILVLTCRCALVFMAAARCEDEGRYESRRTGASSPACKAGQQSIHDVRIAAVMVLQKMPGTRRIANSARQVPGASSKLSVREAAAAEGLLWLRARLPCSHLAGPRARTLAAEPRHVAAKGKQGRKKKRKKGRAVKI
ncbi:hypothetical protein L1887_47144 [Cichorium endivia]|nr:hypothetical protein L1887_47144 [Cichorium endivia]